MSNKVKNQKILIGVAWPYANGELHLGHVAGLIGADFLARYFRVKGKRVMMISGSGCHGTPVAVKAEEENTTPKAISDKYSQKMREDLIDGIGISYDIFTKTSEPFHCENVQEFFLSLYEKGYIYKKTQSLAYCANCDRFLPDRFVEGECPRCDYAKARGDQCDECGALLDFSDLIKPVCKICASTPRPRETEHFFLKLTAFQKPLLEYVQKSQNWRPNAKNATIKLLEGGLIDRAITRNLEWGAPIPLERCDDKVIYVWFEEVLGYLTASQKISQDKGKSDLWRDFWQSDDAYHYYVHGKDNIPFHTVIWPAMLMGAGDLHLPDQIVSSEYLNFSGRQFSKSRKWGVWIGEFLEKYDADTIRYFLAINGPENKDSDFSWKDFEAKINAELLGKLGNFVNRSLSFIESKFDATIPSQGELAEEDKKILKKSQDIFESVGRKIEKAEFKKVMQSIMDFVDACNKYFNDQEPWKAIKEDKERAGTILNICAQAISAISVLVYPFLPNSAQKIKKQLGLDLEFIKSTLEEARENKWRHFEIPAGQKIGNVEAIYKRVEIG